MIGRAPLGAGAASFDLDDSFCSHLPQHMAHHVAAHTGAVVLQIGNAERTRPARDGGADLIGPKLSLARKSGRRDAICYSKKR
jgi:hypothetical protein